MPSKIFINYRRDDDPNGAARVRDGLAGKFGKSNIFMDVDNLLAGQRFDQELAKALAACDVLLAIIGPRWLELLKARAVSGERDYVREEIAAALARRITVIPVLVGREGQMPRLPRADDLPDDIRDLVLYQKHDVAYERFGRECAELVQAITIVRRTQRPELAKGQPWGRIGAGAIAVLAAGYLGAYLLGLPVWWPGGSPTEPTTVISAPVDPDATAAAAVKEEQEATARAEAEAAQKAEEERRSAAAEAARPGRVFRDCADCPEMVVVPAGKFTMGSSPSEIAALTKDFPIGKDWLNTEGPQRPVTIASPFAVGKFEVTFAEWEACVAGGGCASNKTPDDANFGKVRRPVINVSWDDTQEYVAWLSNKSGKSYRLLTEAEWEYAVRAGTRTAYHWGDQFDGAKANNNGSGTVPVGQYAANNFGLHDMHGNVWEWVEDCYVDSYANAPKDGTKAPDTAGCSRVLRGGSWDNVPQDLRAAFRDGSRPGNRSINLGFRLARTLNHTP